MNKKKGHHQPLLYIQQPALAPSAASMQQVYLSSAPPVKTVKKNAKPAVQVEPLAFVEDEKRQDAKIDDTIKPEVKEPEEKNDLKDQKKQGLTRVKPFKDMDIDGRIAYLVPFIGRKAPFRCRFVLKSGEEITGVLVNENEGSITILTGHSEEITVEKSDLTAILIR